VWRYTARSRADAASLVSLSYCASTVLYGAVALSRHTWPENAFDFELHGVGVDSFILFSVAYFATDLVFDWDPRFVAHHVLSLSAMVTTALAPPLQGAFVLTALIAEVGGVAFHVSKLVRRPWMTLLFLVVYSLTRLLAFPALLGWLLNSLLTRPRPVFVWATLGTAGLAVINIRWCRMQWRRFLKERAVAHAALSPAKLHARSTSRTAFFATSFGGLLWDFVT
jgi:multisubunit Na+/H+ antiporter MnhC subunit